MVWTSFFSENHLLFKCPVPHRNLPYSGWWHSNRDPLQYLTGRCQNRPSFCSASKCHSVMLYSLKPSSVIGLSLAKIMFEIWQVVLMIRSFKQTNTQALGKKGLELFLYDPADNHNKPNLPNIFFTGSQIFENSGGLQCWVHYIIFS